MSGIFVLWCKVDESRPQGLPGVENGGAEKNQVSRRLDDQK